MKSTLGWLAVICLAAPVVAAQEKPTITMDQEPHHHLVMRNDDVKVFDVRVQPGGKILLHRHDGDTVAIAIGPQTVTVGIPGKPDVHAQVEDGQVRVQHSGYMHSTSVDKNTHYHTVAVELLHDQTEWRNLCGQVLAKQPLECPDDMRKSSSSYSSEPLVKSDQTVVAMVRVPAHQAVDVRDLAAPHAAQLLVALDPGSISLGSQGEKALPPGAFQWIEGLGTTPRKFKNSGAKEARFVEFIFVPGSGKKAAD